MKYSCATLWHKMPDKTYKRILFDRVLITHERGTEIGGSVRDKKDTLKAKIFSLTKCSISPGDMICDGYEISLTPPPHAYIIEKIRENFGTSANLRHYSIECV